MFTVREAQPEDVEGIHAVHKSTFVQTYRNDGLGLTEEALEYHIQDPEWNKNRKRDYDETIRNAGSGVLFVACAGERIIGFSQGTVLSDSHLRACGLYVRDDYRRQGVATALFKALFEGTPPGDASLQVVPYVPARHFHVAMGFRPAGMADPFVLRGGQELPQEEMVLSAEERVVTLRQINSISRKGLRT